MTDPSQQPPAPRVAERLVEVLAASGVTRVFSVPGGASSGLDHALFRSREVEAVVCQHEAMAGYLAMGYHLATGRPGVVTTTSGPGVLNVAPALASARADEVGLLVLAGDVARGSAHRGALQDGGYSGLDTLHAMRSLAGLVLSIDHPDQAQVRLEQALDRCTATPVGPAFLQVPIDVQNAPVPPPTSGRGPKSLPPAPDPAAIDAAAALLREAKRPVLFVGLGVKRTHTAAQVRALAEHLAIPVLADAEGLGVVPRGHPLFAGLYGVGDTGAGRRFVAKFQPDVILAIGCRLDDTTTNGFSNEVAQARLIQVDYDHRRFGRAFAPRVAVLGSLNEALVGLRHCFANATDEQRSATAAEVAQVKRSADRPFPPLAPPLDPRALVERLSRRCGGHATFVSDIGNHLLAALGYLDVMHPSRFHFSLGLGGMGSGIGMALGLAAAGRPHVIGLCGDGGALMFGNELLTATKYKLPLVLVVFQDGQLGMVQHGIRNIYGSSDAYALPGFDVVGWARSLGAEAMTLQGEADLERIATWAGPGPLVVAAAIDASVSYINPREGVVAFPEEPHA